MDVLRNRFYFQELSCLLSPNCARSTKTFFYILDHRQESSFYGIFTRPSVFDYTRTMTLSDSFEFRKIQQIKRSCKDTTYYDDLCETKCNTQCNEFIWDTHCYLSNNYFTLIEFFEMYTKTEYYKKLP